MSSSLDVENFDNERGLQKARKKRVRRKREEKQIEKPPSTRRIVNFPASQPYIRLIDGEERLCFKYNTKVSESALQTMPRTDLEEHEFCVRFDLESVDIAKLNEKFKADNCVYPRANCEREEYRGNRWIYETECNRLAWQFVSLNPVLLYGKKGLIQRAVDSYRNINKDSKNKRLMKTEKTINGVIKRRYSEAIPTTITVNWTHRGNPRKCKVRIDIDQVNYAKIDPAFKVKYSVFGDVFTDKSFGLAKWESTNEDNELAVKIAYLNVENTTFWNAVKATDKTFLLTKAVEAYKQLSAEEPSSEADFTEIVSETLDKAYVEEEFNILD